MMIRGECINANAVYLTFDDGPDPQWTPRILDILAEFDVLATFFMVGQQARRDAPLARRVRAEGHAIGNHGWSHRHPWTLSAAAARNEVRLGSVAIEDVLGESAGWYRPAHGRLHPSMLWEAKALGQPLVLWTRSAVDWGYFGSAAAIGRRLARIGAGDIVLMHDAERQHNRPDQLVRVLPEQLRSLRNRALQPALLA